MSSENPCRVSRDSDGLHYVTGNLSFRISGLTAYNLDRLRVTVKATLPESAGSFHIDTLDLYNSKAREAFAESCTKYLKVKTAAVMADLNGLIAAREEERVHMRQHGNDTPAMKLSDKEKKEALSFLESKDLLRQIISDFEALGYVGEKNNKLLGYIAAISRLLPDPLALLILSRSGAGKPSLQDAVCKIVPPESVIQYTRLTGQSLFYRDQNALKNKVLAIEEEEGMFEAMYSIKTLISSQKLSVAATRSDAKTGKFSVDEYTVHGPVVVMVSTTNPVALDDETKQRFLVLTIDETPEQTKNILNAQLVKNTHRWYTMSIDESTVTAQHHNAQRLLKPLTVTFPDELRLVWPFGRLQMRREQKKFLSLVKAITLLHQYQRKTGILKRLDETSMDFVQATQRDIDLAFELGRVVFARNIDDMSPTGRTLLAEIVKLVQEKQDILNKIDPENHISLVEIPFTRKELRERIGWSERRRCARTSSRWWSLGTWARSAAGSAPPAGMCCLTMVQMIR